MKVGEVRAYRRFSGSVHCCWGSQVVSPLHERDVEILVHEMESDCSSSSPGFNPMLCKRVLRNTSINQQDVAKFWKTKCCKPTLVHNKLKWLPMPSMSIMDGHSHLVVFIFLSWSTGISSSLHDRQSWSLKNKQVSYMQLHRVHGRLQHKRCERSFS